MFYYGWFDYTGYFLVIIGAMITVVADLYINSNYRKYKRRKVQNGLTGCEVAQTILKANGLEDVYVVETRGMLSDHYDPTRKVVRLSKDVFHGSSIASTSVAAHECGHAIQDKVGYAPLRFRSFLIPFVNIGSHLGYLIVVLGLLFGHPNIAWGGVGLLLLLLLFQLVTLPVEFNASKRAGEELQKLQLLSLDEQPESKKMLRSAAYTYVASLANTILQLLRLVMIVGSRDDN